MRTRRIGRAGCSRPRGGRRSGKGTRWFFPVDRSKGHRKGLLGPACPPGPCVRRPKRRGRGPLQACNPILHGPVFPGVATVRDARPQEVEIGCKSLAMGLILQEESRTLATCEADAVVARFLAALHGEHGAEVRSKKQPV